MLRTSALLSSLVLSSACLFSLETESQEADCGKTSRPQRIEVKHIEAGGIGYSQGYTTLEGFFPLLASDKNWVPFLDLRAHIFNDGKPAVNAGLGACNSFS